MTTFRIDKQRNYTVVDNGFIKDDRLSYKSKGILLYLLSRPDDWNVYESDIVKHSNDGIRSVRSGVQELIENGYIERKQKRTDKNQFAGYEYIVHEQPPFLRFAITENSTLLSTNVTKNNENDNGLDFDKSRRESSSFSSADKNRFANKDVVELIRFYISEMYPHYLRKNHPKLKKEQYRRVYDVIANFAAEYDLEYKGLEDMANAYFKSGIDCDFNINHFATEGILTNRYWEEIYGA